MTPNPLIKTKFKIRQLTLFPYNVKKIQNVYLGDHSPVTLTIEWLNIQIMYLDALKPNFSSNYYTLSLSTMTKNL